MDNQRKFLLEFGLAVLYDCTNGSLLLNNQEFLSIQIDQHMMIMISIEEATPNDLLILLYHPDRRQP
jgi:hypothetical protein